MSSQWMGQHGSEPPNAGQVPVVTSILKDFSAEALGELRTWLEQNPPAVSVTSIIGFSQFVIQRATEITASENTASLTYTDLATVGPTLTMLPNGTYLFFFGSTVIESVAGSAQYMGLQVNATAPSASTQLLSASAQFVPACRISVASLSNAGNNTVTAKYRVDAGTGTFSNRYLYGLRISN